MGLEDFLGESAMLYALITVALIFLALLIYVSVEIESKNKLKSVPDGDFKNILKLVVYGSLAGVTMWLSHKAYKEYSCLNKRKTAGIY